MRTKKARIVVLLSSAVLIILAAHQIAAQDLVPGQYTGKTSQGFPMDLTVVGSEEGTVIQSWNFGFELHCEKSGQVMNVGMGFFGFNVPIKDGKFRFNYEESFMFTFAMDGIVFQGIGLVGSVGTNWAAIVPKRVQAELCGLSSSPPWQKVLWVATPDTKSSHPFTGILENDLFISLTRDPETGLVSEVFVK